MGTVPERCIAIGDSENDLDMLKAVGMPVAMGNAIDDVKALAKYITDTNARTASQRPSITCWATNTDPLCGEQERGVPEHEMPVL